MTPLSLDNQAKGTIGETVVRLALTSLGAGLEPHEIWEGGADIRGTLNGVSLAFEVNDWYGGYFHPSRFESIQTNLVQTKATYLIHFSMGVKPTAEQYADSKEIGIISIHYPQQILSINQSIVIAVRSLIVSALHLNLYNRFYKVRCIGNNHLANTSRVLLLYTSNISNTAFSRYFSSFFSKIKSSCDTALTKFSSKIHSSSKSCLDNRSKSMDSRVCETIAPSTIVTNGWNSKDDTSSPPSNDLEYQPPTLDFNPTIQYYLVTADTEYSFLGSKVSEDYVEAQWNSLISDKPIPKVTVILVASETLTKIVSSEVDSFTTPLLPQRDSYLVLIQFKDNQQFKESIHSEFVRIWAELYVNSLRGEELLKFQHQVEEISNSRGVYAPKVLPNSSIYY